MTDVISLPSCLRLRIRWPEALPRGAVDVLKETWVVDPCERPKASQILSHSWTCMGAPPKRKLFLLPSTGLTAQLQAAAASSGAEGSPKRQRAEPSEPSPKGETEDSDEPSPEGETEASDEPSPAPAQPEQEDIDEPSEPSPAPAQPDSRAEPACLECSLFVSAAR